MIFYNKIRVLDIDFYVARLDDKIVYIDTQDNIAKTFKNYEFIKSNDSFLNVKTQLEGYLLGKRKIFTIKHALIGSEFNKRVLTELYKIPFGTTITYKQLAEKIGNVRQVRAAATAVGKNPLLIIIPCHRVIGSDGKLHGFKAGLEMKKRLLQLEGTSV